MGTPQTSVSRVAVRMIVSSGGSQRTPSSMHCGMRERSFRIASSWAGSESNPNKRLLDERYVVSAPAGARSRAKARIASSSSCAPSTSALTRTLTRSSVGCARRSAMRRRKRSPSFPDAARALSRSSITLISSIAHRWKSPKSSSETPSIPAITRTGKGKVRSRTRSADPFSQH